MTTEVITTTAQAAKHAARAFAQAISLDRGDLDAEHVAARAGELREILTSARLALRVIEQAAPDAATPTCATPSTPQQPQPAASPTPTGRPSRPPPPPPPMASRPSPSPARSKHSPTAGS